MKNVKVVVGGVYPLALDGSMKWGPAAPHEFEALTDTIPEGDMLIALDDAEEGVLYAYKSPDGVLHRYEVDTPAAFMKRVCEMQLETLERRVGLLEEVAEAVRSRKVWDIQVKSSPALGTFFLKAIHVPSGKPLFEFATEDHLGRLRVGKDMERPCANIINQIFMKVLDLEVTRNREAESRDIRAITDDSENLGI